MRGQTRTGSARLNAYHGTKQQLVGTNAGQVAPSWRSTTLQQGSKIMLSNLPMDVAESELEDLFKRTIGPMKDVFLIYNNQGRSKGMAVVTFQRPTDAGLARTKYNGKVIDGRHKIKIEIVTDSDELPPRLFQDQAPGPPSLLSRIAGPHFQPSPKPVFDDALHSSTSKPKQHPSTKKGPIAFTVSGPKKRTKKGPKRIKKSLDQLDQDMEDYRASIVDG
ncbi:hypothetical protein BC834DRAFT_895358 [Gloeopeniophorella convolvens]|nr:hypothetical protein BC834DRAFT_895358 [Gloeopeniophorella convolvens]